MPEDMNILLDQLDDDTAQVPVLGSQSDSNTVEILQVDGTKAELPVIDVREHVQRISAVSDEILSSWRSDRAEAQDAANFVMDLMLETRSHGQQPSATMVEQYMNALKIKSDTNQTAVRCMDGITKVLTATKPGAQSQTNNVMVGNKSDLIAALQRPMAIEDP